MVTESHIDREWTVDEIVEELDAEHSGVLPEQALRQAQSRREEVIPRLIELIGAAAEERRAGRRPKG